MKKDDKNNNTSWDKMNFPIVRNISPRFLSDDIFPYIPGNKTNEAIWKKEMKSLYESIKKTFDETGIPIPKFVLDTTSGPITYESLL